MALELGAALLAFSASSLATYLTSEKKDLAAAIGGTLASLIGEIAGGRAEGALDNLQNRIRTNLGALGSLQPDENADLERALRCSYWESIIFLVSLWAARHQIPLETPRRPFVAWLAAQWNAVAGPPQSRQVQAYAVPLQRICTRISGYLADPGRFSHLIPGDLPASATAAASMLGTETPRLACLAAVLTEIQHDLDPPADLREAAEKYWPALLCAAFQYHFKHDTPVYRILTGRLLSGIDLRLQRVEDKIDYLVQGLRSGVSRCDGQIQDFLTFYLGTSARPEPFGGRDAELQALSDWLDDPGAQPFLLLTAEAGRGKSALLARWAARLTLRADIHLVYFPVSARFQTCSDVTVFGALAAHFHAIHQSGSLGQASADQYRSVFRDLQAKPAPDGKPVLLILDGLDEAAFESWAGALPIEPSARLKIVAAARLDSRRPWKELLQWRACRPFPLGLLDQAGVREVLDRMGNPLQPLAAKIDVVRTLHRLSEGDPLVLGLYVEELRSRAADPAFDVSRLADLKPGLGEFFEAWLEHQRAIWRTDHFPEAAVLRLLHLLSSAHGPLSRNDLHALAPEVFDSIPRLDATIAVLRRFVVGSEAGYVLCHPRFGQFWRGEKMLRHERRVIDGAFADYLRAQVSGGVAPAEVSPYAVRWATAHLTSPERAGLAEALISARWHDAWEALEGTYSGFLTDVDRVVEAAAGDLGIGIRSLLFRGSLLAVSRSIGTDLFALCLRHGVLTVPLGVAMAREQEPVRRAHMLLAVAGRPGVDRQGFLAEALAAARAIDDDRARSNALAAVVPHLANPGPVLEEALAAARAIDDDWARSSALAAVVPHLAGHPHLLAEALAAARAIDDHLARSNALAAVVSHLAGHPHLLAEALAAARAIDDEEERSRALAAVASHLANPGPVLEEALATARAIDDHLERSRALAAVAPHLADPGPVLAEALAAASAIDDEWDRAGPLKMVARLLAGHPQLLAEALAAARAFDQTALRSEALAVLAPHLADPGPVLAEAAATARLSFEFRPALLAILAPHLADPGPELAEALAAARGIDDEVRRFSALAKVASHLADPGPALAATLAAACAIDDEWARSRALQAVVPHVAGHPQLLAEALTAASAIDEKAARTRALAAVAAPHPVDPGPLVAAALPHGPDPLEEQMFVAIVRRSAGHPQLLADRLFGFAFFSESEYAERVRHLSRHPQLLAETLTAARTIEDEEERGDALAAVAPYISDARQLRSLFDACTGFGRSEVLQVLAAAADSLARIAGPAVLEGVSRSIREVTARWP